MKPLTIFLMMSTVLAFSTQMYELAEESSAKAVSFADEMNDAIDCAARGIDITLCSPNILDFSVADQMNNFTALLDEIYINQTEINILLEQADTIPIYTEEFEAQLKLESVESLSAFFSFVTTVPELNVENFELHLNEQYDMDLNADSQPDLILALVDVESEYALISFSEPETIAGTQVTGAAISESTARSPSQTKLSSLWLVTIFILLTIWMDKTSKRNNKNKKGKNRIRKIRSKK